MAEVLLRLPRASGDRPQRGPVVGQSLPVAPRQRG